VRRWVAFYNACLLTGSYIKIDKTERKLYNNKLAIDP